MVRFYSIYNKNIFLSHYNDPVFFDLFKIMIIHHVSMRVSESYLIEFDQNLVLVDAGIPGLENRILERIGHLNHSDLKIILITHAHFDHYGSAAALRDLTGAKIAIHTADANAMAKGETRLGSSKGRGKIVSSLFPILEKMYPLTPTPPDIEFKDGEEFHVNGTCCKVIHTPGHTLGSSTYIFNEQYAFVGDLISNNGKPHAQKYFAQDWSLLPLSTQLIKSSNPRWIYTGHGKKPVNQAELQRL